MTVFPFTPGELGWRVWYGGSGWDWAGHSCAGTAGQLHQTEAIPRKAGGVLSCGGCGIHTGADGPPPLGPGCCCPLLLFLQGEKSYPKGFLLVLSSGLGDGATQVKCFPHFLCSHPQCLRSLGCCSFWIVVWNSLGAIFIHEQPLNHCFCRRTKGGTS